MNVGWCIKIRNEHVQNAISGHSSGTMVSGVANPCKLLIDLMMVRMDISNPATNVGSIHAICFRLPHYSLEIYEINTSKQDLVLQCYFWYKFLFLLFL